MITKLETLLDVLGTPNTQLVIPVYQRVYSWTEAQCNTLWEDVLQAGKTGSPHFVGTILHNVEEGYDCNASRVDAACNPAVGPGVCPASSTDVPAAGSASSPAESADAPAAKPDLRRIDVVDGQQRLATVSLLIAALRDYLAEEGKLLLDMGPGELSCRYLEAPAVGAVPDASEVLAALAVGAEGDFAMPMAWRKWRALFPKRSFSATRAPY